MKNPENDSPQSETDARVWEMLNESATAKAGPFFSRNVMREIRLLEADAAEKSGFFAWFRQPVAALCGAVAAMVILAVALGPDGSGVEGNSISVTHTEVIEGDPADEFADMNYFGELMAVSDPALLDDQAFASLF